uniref:Carbohydrate-binding family 6 protein n=1 Tax=Solibacter usitatus (strain Ellin6076) TaxID=234267 RepID=Q01ZD6_SOLUE
MKHLAVFLYAVASFAQSADLQYDPASPQAAFAATEIRRAFAARGQSLVENGGGAQPIRLVLTATAAKANAAADSLGVARLKDPSPQSYAIRRVQKAGVTTVAVLAADGPGAMYGGLDLAEAVRLGTLGSLANTDHSPYIEKRGIKFNVPLDARTPSYSDNSDAAQNNIAEMWSIEFWHEFIDEMARHRYNVLSLWSLHPFPSLVKVPEFPDVALNDVMRTKVPMDDTFSASGSDMVRPVTLTKLETLRTMTIDQKIAFWREVMQYAADRGVEVYWFTWNIFTFGAEGKYGITSQQDNPKTIDYFRASVRELILTYPLLAGIGITAGEHMQNRKDEFASEKWLWRTYGLGIMDAKKLQPARSVRLIHRYHQTVQSEILDAFQSYPDTFELSFKYAIAHMYSIPNPPFIQAALPHISSQHRTWLTVRDDDVYSFRWGNPEFARAFIRNMPGKDKVTGFYMGPDGYIWGREFMSTEPESPRQLVISKRWYSFMLWGRLSYDPELPDSLFLKTLAARFPEAPAEKLSTAWSAASMVFPQITRFFWGDIDLRWFPEACLSHPKGAKGFYTVANFMDGETMPGSGALDILEWRKKLAAGEAMNGTTPLQIADALAANAQTALRLLAELRAMPQQSKELRLTLGDMEAMAHLGNYYAAKIRGAADLALFDQSGKAAQKESAIVFLQQALDHWKRYATAYTVQYRQPLLYNRVGWVDIPGLTGKVEQDISIARLWAPGTLSDAARKRSADNPFRQ